MISMKKHIFKYLVFIFVLAFLPNHASAIVSTDIFANLGVPTFSLSGGAVLDWTAGTGEESRASLAGVSTTFNGEADPYFADYGFPWQNTYMTASHGTTPNTATGSADTHSSLTPAYLGTMDPDRLYASSNISLSSTNSASVFSQAVLSGQFTVNQATTLTVTLPYTLRLLLSGAIGGFSAGDATAGLFLYDYNGYDPQTGQSPALLTSQQMIIAEILNSNAVYDSGLLSGTLTLNFGLVPDFIYDFEAFASTNSSAAVPLPGTVILFGPAVLALAMFRKKFIQPKSP